MELTDEARCMNEIAAFVGPRDVAALDRVSLAAAGLADGMADVAVLFGGSIVAGGDVFAEAMRARIARRYVIAGGAGHTTPALREAMRRLHPKVAFTDDASEAEVFDAYLRTRCGLSADLLECASTNCGNNVTNLLALLDARGVARRSMVVVQDASMQRRMEAGLRLHAPGTRIVNYAAYRVSVRVAGEAGSKHLAYDQVPAGMWDVERYRSLLMGEVPRLVDGEGGYGPRGAGYIAHVDVPASVADAFERLRAAHPESVRVANPAFAGTGRR